MLKYTKLLILFFCMFGTLMAQAQINLLVGYNLGYSKSDRLNNTIDAHNGLNPWYKIPLEKPGLDHGLLIGIRYNMDNIRLAAVYRNRGQRLEGEGIKPGEENSFKREINLRNNIISLGLETAFQITNWGISLDYNIFSSTGKVSDISNRYDLSKDHIWSSHVYMNIDFYGSSNMSFSIQPYVQIPFQTVNMNELSDELEVPGGLKADFTTFGVALILVNGPKN